MGNPSIDAENPAPCLNAEAFEQGIRQYALRCRKNHNIPLQGLEVNRLAIRCSMNGDVPEGVFEEARAIMEKKLGYEHNSLGLWVEVPGYDSQQVDGSHQSRDDDSLPF